LNITRAAAAKVDESAKAKRPKVWDSQRNALRDVPERVAAPIAVRIRIGKRPAADAVEDDEDNARKSRRQEWFDEK
jgi:hypothetical protein